MSRRKRRPSSCSNSSFNYSSLEPRQLLATLFSGTDGNDTASVTYVDETHVNVLIGDTLTENVDITDGIRIDLGGNTFGAFGTANYVGSTDPEELVVASGDDRITIDHRITGELLIFNTEIIEVDGGSNRWQIGFLADNSTTETSNSELVFADPVSVGGVVAGRLNENITFVGANEIYGGDLGDDFTINSTNGNGLAVYGGAGDDVFRFNATELNSRQFGISAVGAGGNDRFILHGFAEASANGGEGYDVVDYSRSLLGVSLNYFSLRAAGENVDGNDKFIGAAGQENSISQFGDVDLNWFINGRGAKVLDPVSGATVELENFNQFNGSNRSADNFYVIRTAYEVEIFDADWIQISSTIDAEAGNLDWIQHDIKISRSLRELNGSSTEFYLNDIDGVVNPTVIISDATSDGVVAQFGKNQIISRQGGGNILFGIEFSDPFTDRDATERVAFEPNITFHGSKTERDVFIVAETWGETTIVSYGGDDLFMIGSTNGDANGVLGKVNDKLDIQSGEGYDQLYVNDQSPELSGATGDANLAVDSLPFEIGASHYYSLSDTNMIKSGVGTRVELGFSSDLEFVRLNAALPGSIQVSVAPSQSTKFVISGKTEYSSSDVIGISGTERSSGTIEEIAVGTGSYSFGELAERVHFYNMRATLTDFRLV